MKDIIALKEKINLIEQEIKTLTDKAAKWQESLKEIDDLKTEIKGLKLFLGRVYPDFKSQFPDILKKL